MVTAGSACHHFLFCPTVSDNYHFCW